MAGGSRGVGPVEGLCPDFTPSSGSGSRRLLQAGPSLTSAVILELGSSLPSIMTLPAKATRRGQVVGGEGKGGVGDGTDSYLLPCPVSTKGTTRCPENRPAAAAVVSPSPARGSPVGFRHVGVTSHVRSVRRGLGVGVGHDRVHGFDGGGGRAKLEHLDGKCTKETAQRGRGRRGAN